MAATVCRPLPLELCRILGAAAIHGFAADNTGATEKVLKKFSRFMLATRMPPLTGGRSDGTRVRRRELHEAVQRVAGAHAVSITAGTIPAHV